MTRRNVDLLFLIDQRVMRIVADRLPVLLSFKKLVASGIQNCNLRIDFTEKAFGIIYGQLMLSAVWNIEKNIVNGGRRKG